ncbi:DegV family protein [Clostridium felsineum]|uniref:DegV family protein n=1 Tax=Clostridium felsineum TaxID=36839 RepID=UPI00098BFC20|nr:DegV family protein [Clostridium felsineum]URZ15531.1 DegV domain-containing protein [Clostridium felsineum DSM 794]
MEKIAIITDTTADLTTEFIKEHNINVLSFRIIYRDREYKDKVDITSEEVYKNFEIEVPKSSMPALQDMEELYQKLEEEGYTHAIGITLSSGLSGIFNGLKMIAEEHNKIKSFIYDSKLISLGEGAIVEECVRMLENNKSFDEIVNEIPEIRKRIHLFFVVGTLDYLRKGGRIGKIAGTIGKLLNIKPIVSVDENGVYYAYDKVRGRKQSLNRVLEIAKDITKENNCRAYVMHGHAEEETREFFEKIKGLPNINNAMYNGCISPVSGVHSGPGLVGLVLLEE